MIPAGRTEPLAMERPLSRNEKRMAWVLVALIAAVVTFVAIGIFTSGTPDPNLIFYRVEHDDGTVYRCIRDEDGPAIWCERIPA